MRKALLGLLIVVLPLFVASCNNYTINSQELPPLGSQVQYEHVGHLEIGKVLAQGDSSYYYAGVGYNRIILVNYESYGGIRFLSVPLETGAQSFYLGNNHLYIKNLTLNRDYSISCDAGWSNK